MPAYVTLLPGAFSDDSVAGSTVRVESVHVDEPGAAADVWFEFTWPENPWDVDSVSAVYCRTATDDEVREARIAYQEADG